VTTTAPIDTLDQGELERLFAATVLDNPWIPQEPTLKQAEFLMHFELEGFYGGAAGGGKTDGLLMAALQFVEWPDYHALMLRKTYADLSLPGALMDQAQQWLIPLGADWNEIEKTFTFPPHGSTLSFGYLQYERDKYRYDGPPFQFIAWDELTQHPRSTYSYLFGRVRRRSASNIPLRVRGASNPGGLGHEWVKEDFVDSETRKPGTFFIPAKLKDNPHLDYDSYVRSLSHLDPITRARLLNGDWTAAFGGSKFQRHWFDVVEAAPASAMKLVRYWDLAATAPKPGKDPDYTVGLLLGRTGDGVFYILDVRRRRLNPKGIEDLLKQTAITDGKSVDILIEQEPGASGKILIDHLIRHTLAGFSVKADKVSGSKELRANPVSSQAEAGNVKILARPWTRDLLEELEAFPEGSHKDQVDALSGALNGLTPVESPFLIGRASGARPRMDRVTAARATVIH